MAQSGLPRKDSHQEASRGRLHFWIEWPGLAVGADFGTLPHYPLVPLPRKLYIEDMFLPIDSRKRISLSKVLGESKAAFFEVSVTPEGDIVLKPMAAIPERERWAWERPGLIEGIKKGITDSKAGRAKPYSKIR